MDDIVIRIAGMTLSLLTTLGFFVVMIVLIYFTVKNARKKRAEIHAERMLAMEKGIPLPADIKSAFDARKRFLGSMQAGLVCLMSGLGTAIALGLVSGWVHAAWGGILFFIGVGLIIFAVIVKASAEEVYGDNDD
ncbi:MAG: hypothetical protein GY771_07935 [bacterium]|nr:hypothetical protein [bacterium]